MNKELQKLKFLCSSAINNGQSNMETIKLLVGTRNNIYNQIKNTSSPINAEDVLEEKTLFWAIPSKILCNPRLSNDLYIDILNMIIDKDPALELLNSQDAIEVLNLDEKMLNEILKPLKLNPRKAGAKINDIKKAKKIILKRKEEYEKNIESQSYQ